MMDLLVSSLFSWLNIFGQPQQNLQPLKVFAWEDSAIFNLPTARQDPQTESIVQTYLQNISSQEIKTEQQGIWVQSNWITSGNEQSKKPLPAASLTKIATTLTTLHKWGAEHQFKTNIYGTGAIIDGVLNGDLIVKGSGDPLFVWEEAIALGNTLNQQGIRQVQGDILVTDKFYMNFQVRSKLTGEMLKQALDQKRWQPEVTQQYLQMPPSTRQPEIVVSGQVKAINKLPSTAKLLVTHKSLPLAEILRQMNIYSNNKMAQMLADLAGGASKIAQLTPDIAHFPATEIQLINGSGLGEENRISPRAICQMLTAIDRLLESYSLSAADLFPTAGRDRVGTMQNRNLPPGTTIKTGTLDNVSALAGVLPTSYNPEKVVGSKGLRARSPIQPQIQSQVQPKQSKVYFAIINHGPQVEYFRQQQDYFLHELAQTWEPIPSNLNLALGSPYYLGDPGRNSPEKDI